jgi:hypothetical protein
MQKASQQKISFHSLSLTQHHYIISATAMCVYVVILISFATFIIYQIAMCIWRWLFKSYFDLDKIIKQPEDFNEGMDVEKWVSNFGKFADHNNKRHNTVRGQFLLNHMDASSRLVLESYNRKSNKSLIDYTKLKPMLFQLFSSKTRSNSEIIITKINKNQPTSTAPPTTTIPLDKLNIFIQRNIRNEQWKITSAKKK